MKIKQLSVFIENKVGRINEVVQVLGDNGINMTAFSLAENIDFGILRLIVSDVDKAVKVLKDAKFGVNITDVVCLSCPNVAGSLSTIMKQLAKEDVFIEYMYAFSQGEVANVVIKPNDIDKCIAVLDKCACDIVKL